MYTNSWIVGKLENSRVNYELNAISKDTHVSSIPRDTHVSDFQKRYSGI